MHHIVRSALILVTVLGLCPFATAWHQAGHQIVAAIAYRQLTPGDRATLVAILKNHPRFDEDFDSPMSDELDSSREVDVNDWLLQRAAIWPDLARSFKPAEKMKYHHGDWHFINQPCWLNPGDQEALKDALSVNLELTAPDVPQRKMNVIQTIRLARRMLARPDADKADKAVMLAWLIHTVGDVHQPLHAAALYSQHLFPKNDRGGNAIPTEHNGNLHALWDDLPGGRIKFNTVRGRAAAILADNRLKSLGEHAADQLDETVWMDESRTYAISTAYDDEVLTPLREAEDADDTGELEPLELSDEYMKAAGKLASQRLAEAGFRLNRILKEVAEANR